MGNIGMSIPVKYGDVDIEKVAKAMKKFGKVAEKSEMTTVEVGAAIALLADGFYECYEAIPLSEEMLDRIKDTRFYKLQED
jgi:hypothetical protein